MIEQTKKYNFIGLAEHGGGTATLFCQLPKTLKMVISPCPFA